MVGVGNRKHKCVKKKNIQVFAWDVELKSKKKFFADLFFYVKTSYPRYEMSAGKYSNVTNNMNNWD